MVNRAKGGVACDTSIVTSRAEVAVRLSAGSGTAILLIHSVDGSSAQFNHLFEMPFANQYRLIAIDLPGHGNSSQAYDPETACTTEGYADVALEILERLDVDDAFVVDASRGGVIGRELMTIFPGMLGLAIVDGGPNRENPVVSGVAPIYMVEGASGIMLTPVFSAIPALEAAFARTPLLWYGG